MARLLVSSLRVELEPHDITPVWHVRARHYQASRPTGSPVEISAWRFRALTPRSNSWSEYFGRRIGRTIKPPSSMAMSTVEPASTAASVAKDLGIRSPKQFPHFWIFVNMHPPRIYNEYTPSGCPHVAVAQQFLDSADVMAPFKQMRGKGMAQGMARRPLGETPFFNGPLEGFLENGFVDVMPALFPGP